MLLESAMTTPGLGLDAGMRKHKLRSELVLGQTSKLWQRKEPRSVIVDGEAVQQTSRFHS